MPATLNNIPSQAHDSAPSVTELEVTGMTCGNCVRHVNEAVRSVPGVRSAVVSLDARRASVRWSEGADRNIPALLQAIQHEGYGATVLDAAAARPGSAERKLAGWRLNLWIGVLGTLPLMIGEWAFGIGENPSFQWFSFVLAAIVQFWAGAPFYRGAWSQLKVGSSNMDTLVALGSTTAFAYSAGVMISGRGGHVYFMESAAIITLISIGHWLESRVSVRASSALRDLLNLAPQKARKLNFNPSSPLQIRSEVEVPVAALRTNDVIVLRPGERVPTDGEVIEGSSAVDESMLTGESIPKDKTTGDRVYTGTVNLNGRLLVRVQETGDATALAHIIQAVERAQTSRAQIQRLGDRVSSVFVPIVVVIAILSGLWWGLAPEPARHLAHWLQQYLWHSHPPAGTLAAAVLSAAAVLIVACPCAMGLATPAAIMAGANAAAQRGILIRDGVALEKAGKINGVIFDKTGTLTAGKPSVAEVWTNPASPLSLSHPMGEGWGEGSVLELAAALARNSTHPVSQALANIAPVAAEIRNWQELRGAGLQAETKTAGGEWINARLGSLNWMKEWGVNCDAGAPFISKWTTQGATVAGLAADGVLAGLFALRDSIKPSAPAVVRQLQDQGFETFLVTGDTVLTAETIGRELGIPGQNIFAEVRPEKKAEFVKKLQAQGKRVAFVGDGINDAPALEQSDLGIAVTRASDIAREAADIVLLNSELEAVPQSLGLARATLRTIKQNLFWAFFYNAVGVPLAALGFMSPILCAGAMAISDIVVIGNALRLLRWKSPVRRNR